MLLRPHQWVKNAFVLAPLLLTPDVLSAASLLTVAAGAVAFSAVSSAMYILNDYLDRESDRAHPLKRLRPLASGAVRPAVALGLHSLLMVAGFGLAVWLSPAFALLLAVYALLNAAYSLRLKHLAIVDVFVIALGFVLRVEGGAILAAVESTVWITIITGLLALFIALAKRRDDLVKSLDNAHRRSLDGYNKPFLDAAVVVVLGALLVAYLIYTTDAEVMARMASDRLYYTAPFVVAGIMRYLQIIFVEERSGAPTALVLTDRFLIITILGWMATLGWLLYA
ncbi:MAG: UbiA prenyltransferase family protein [Dehalococcoidia bacterium]